MVGEGQLYRLMYFDIVIKITFVLIFTGVSNFNDNI